MEIEEIKRLARNNCSWQDRLKAVNYLKGNDSQVAKDILTRLAIHDPVYKVKEAAFRAAQELKVVYGGKSIHLGKKTKGNLVKEVTHKLCVVRDKLDENYTIEEFKIMFQKLYPEAYDIYDGNMGSKFDNWLSNVIPNLPKKK